MINASKKSISLTTGPSGRAVAQQMEADLIQALYQHTSLERSSSAEYFGISLWFFERELRGFADFFSSESVSEQEHASKFAKYLIARGQTVVLDEIPSPDQEWASIEAIIKATFQMEADVTSSIQQIYSMAERTGDTRTTVFLDPIIEEQIKTEDYMAYLLGKVKFSNNDPSAILLIDNELMHENDN